MVLDNMKNWEKKELVRGLRREGRSYKEIRKQIFVSKSTISHWCKDITLTPKQLSRLNINRRVGGYVGSLKGAKSNQLKRTKEVQVIKAAARSEISPLAKEEFRIAGLMLYWAEGNKSQKVGFSNSDPELIRFIMQWFRKICKVSEDKFRVYMQLHSGQDEMERKIFWSNVTGLSFSRFGKSYIKKEGSGHRKNNLYNGTLLINICDKNLLYKILAWIDGVAGKGR